MSLASCVKCGREWNGTSACHCSACHEHFASLSAFDRHRKAFECLPVEEFSTPHGKHGLPRLVRAQRPTGPVWVTALRDLPSIPFDDEETE